MLSWNYLLYKHAHHRVQLIAGRIFQILYVIEILKFENTNISINRFSIY